VHTGEPYQLGLTLSWSIN